MDLQQKQKIHQCVIQGTVDRNCHICSAHHSRDGGCCFGLRWSENDEECCECRHSDDCQEETFQFHTQRPDPPIRSHRTVNRSPFPNNPTNYSSPIPINRGFSPPTTNQLVPLKGDTFRRVLKDGTWSGLEGFFKSVYDFFRSSRWQ